MGIGISALRMAEAGMRATRAAGQQPAGAGIVQQVVDRAQAEAERRTEEREAEQLAMRLDEAVRAVGRYVWCTPAQVDAMVLLAAQTWVPESLVTMPRGLWVAPEPESGKTRAMMVTASLCRDPQEVDGTGPSLTSRLALAGNQGNACPTLIYDEVSKIFGPGGTRGGNNPIGDILRKGYKSTATQAWSVDRSPVEFSVFSTFLITGLMAAVPRDIRTRCIVFRMQQGQPAEYFDVRDAEKRMAALARSFGAAVKGNREKIAGFRARGLHPKLEGRRLEIWEGMFAVAYCASQEWLNRCMTAFCEIALDESDQPPLSPEQMVIRDLADAVSGIDLLPGGFAPGMTLVDELKRTGDDMYDGRSDASLACLIRDALPFASVQKRFGDKRVRGYYAADIVTLWDQIRPADLDDVIVPDEVNPFTVTGEEDDVTDEPAAGHDEVTGVTAVTGSSE